MPDVGTFHGEFAQALLRDPAAHDAVNLDGSHRGFAVHRNNVLKALIDALADNYPTVERLVGGEWFSACAKEYVRAHPPAAPTLALYGAGFASYLSSFEPAAALPYLPDIARIDRLWIEAYFARDATPLPANALVGMAPERIFEQHVGLHPAMRFGWFDHSAVTIWLHNRLPAPDIAALEVDGAAEGVLLTRPSGAVEVMQVDVATVTFLGAIQEGATLGAAATAALSIDPSGDVAGHLANLLHAGAFAELETGGPEDTR